MKTVRSGAERAVTELFLVVLSSPSADCKEKVMEENQQQNKREERRKKLKAVEMIHVSSNSSMENQCAQQ